MMLQRIFMGTWNVRPMNQGKLDVGKQEMARVNINILGISKLKWTGMGEFNSGDHYIYYCGQKFLKRNRKTLIVNKSFKCRTWMQSQKWQNDLGSFSRQTIQHHTNPSLCPNHWCQRRWTFLWSPTRPFITNTKKWCPFIIGDNNAKIASQKMRRVTDKFGLVVQNEARQMLAQFC